MKIIKLFLVAMATCFCLTAWPQATPGGVGTDTTVEQPIGTTTVAPTGDSAIQVTVPDGELNQPGLTVEEVVATNAKHFQFLDFLIVWLIGWTLKLVGVKDYMTKGRQWGRWVALVIFGVAFTARLIFNRHGFDLDELVAIAVSTASAIGIHAGFLNPGENILKLLWQLIKQRRDAAKT